MRKIKRSIARANMIRAGYEHINRKVAVEGEKKKRSAFSRHWREFVK